MSNPIHTLKILAIETGKRLRELDADWAQLLSISMGQRGLDVPIRVRPIGPDGKYRLVAGLHRLAAAELLGWTEIDAVLFDGDDLAAELLEIDENLMRRELSELDRGTFLARRKAVWEAMNPQARHGGDRRSDQITKVGNLIVGAFEGRFTAGAAAKLGVSERVIQRAVSRFEGLAPDVRQRIANHRVAQRGTQLDLLVRYPADQQRLIADDLLRTENPAKSVRDALERLGLIAASKALSPTERDYRKLTDTWGNSATETKTNFLRFVVASANKRTLATLRAELSRLDGAAGAEDGAA